MNRIRILDQQTANSIAAGEVVERPASVVKELVENALDAGASVISVEIVQGGIIAIRVTDNGCGMSQNDALLAFARHATSKISQIDDLDRVVTMGFRGEALASIAAVSKVRLETRQPEDEKATFVVIHGGEMLDSGWTGSPAGTSIQIENLFFNVPARFKFLRKDTTEAGVVTDVIERLALARPDVSFRLLSNRQEVLHTPGNNDLLSTVYAIYGKQAAAVCLPVDQTQPPLRLSGLIGRPEQGRNSRAWQSFFVNGRLVRSKAMTAALDDAYQTMLMKGKYAFAVLFLELPPNLVDVNVHPQKMEVRFWNDQDVFRMVYHALKSALTDSAGISVQDEQQNAPPSTQAAAAQVSIEICGHPATPPTQPLPLRDNPIVPEYEMLTHPAENQVLTPIKPQLSVEAANKLPALLQINDLERARLIGQLFNTYILMELDQELQ